jgi:para-aminobenzoate synthetase
MTEPVLDAVRAGFARSDRVFWLDGGGARDWSGRRSLVGVLDDDDVSLTFDAARREVTRHAAGRSDVVGDDVFAVLEQEVARDAGDSDVHWVGCFGYGSRPDLGARPWGIGPDAVWMRSRDVRFFDHDPVVSRRSPALAPQPPRFVLLTHGK